MPTHFRKPGTKLTPREDLFVNAVVAGKRKYVAFMESHDCEKIRVAQNRSTELMRDPRIIQAIEERQQELHKTLIAKLVKMSADALDELYDLMQSETASIRLKAAAEILKASTSGEKVNVEVNAIAQAESSPREVTVRYVKKNDKGELEDV